MKQHEFAEKGGIAVRTYCNYESGKRVPDSKFLAAIAAAGADVNYILTGHRAHLINEDNPGYTLRPDQKALLDNYEHCSPKDQDSIKQFAFRSAEAAKFEETQHDYQDTPQLNHNG